MYIIVFQIWIYAFIQVDDKYECRVDKWTQKDDSIIRDEGAASTTAGE